MGYAALLTQPKTDVGHPAQLHRCCMRPAMGKMLPRKRRPAHVGLQGSVAPVAHNICSTVTPRAEADYHKARNDGLLRSWCPSAPVPLSTSHSPLPGQAVSRTSLFR